MHVDILASALLRTKLRLLKRRLKDIATIILNSVSRLHCYAILFFELLFQLLRLIVEVLPDDITGLLFF
jgi:hypothetical protein